jgi:hypothetical protein
VKFRKHISLFLAFFLLLSNLGMACNVHYCDGQVASVTLNTSANSHEIEKECCGIVEKDSKCCHNEIVKSSDKSDQIIQKSNLLVFDVFIINTDSSFEFLTTNFHFQKSTIITYFCDANAPPLYLLYSQYTFYA